MSKFWVFVTILVVLSLLLSAVGADTADASFKDHECKGKSCEPRTGQSKKCEGPSRRSNPHC